MWSNTFNLLHLQNFQKSDCQQFKNRSIYTAKYNAAMPYYKLEIAKCGIVNGNCKLFFDKFRISVSIFDLVTSILYSMGGGFGVWKEGK